MIILRWQHFNRIVHKEEIEDSYNNLTDKKKKIVQESYKMPSPDWSVSRNNNSGLYV